MSVCPSVHQPPGPLFIPSVRPSISPSIQQFTHLEMYAMNKKMANEEGADSQLNADFSW
jgi:hypothetical protein